MTPAPRYARWWGRGVALGLQSLVAARTSRDLREAVRLLLCPIDLWRYHEFAAVISGLGRPSRALDIGSPKVLAPIARAELGIPVWCSDISREALHPRAACAPPIQCDAANLPFPDRSVPCVYSVSTIEHIAGDGDTAAMREIVRVLAPGGKAVITVPLVPQYRERWIDSDPYGKQARSADGSVFFSRYYDGSTLESRLVRAAGDCRVRIDAWQESQEGWYDRYCRITGRATSLRSILTKVLDIWWAARHIVPVEGGPQNLSRHGIAAIVIEKR